MLATFPMLFVVTLSWLHGAHACTTFAVGKKATVDGSVIVSHSEDENMWSDPRLTYVPAMDHPLGSKRKIYDDNENFPHYVGYDFGPDYFPNKDQNAKEPIGEIPQVEHTFAYHDADFGVMNEHNLAIGESTCNSAILHPSRGTALFNMVSLVQIAMERCMTARCAIKLMGELAVNHGYYGMLMDFPAEALHVADQEEVWAFHIIPDPSGTSAIWAAKRVPDEHVSVIANLFTIIEVNVTDEANYLASPNVFSVASELGLWTPGEPFSFTKVYSGPDEEPFHKYYSGRRMWRAFDLIRPSLNLSPWYESLLDSPYPWSVKPEKLVSVRDVMQWHRDFLRGTKFDMTKGISSGPFGSPDSFNYNTAGEPTYSVRGITIYRAVYVHVQQIGGQMGLSGVTWFAAGPAHHAPFVPVPSGMNQSFAPLSNFMTQHSSPGSLFWAVSNVLTVCQARFDKMHPIVEQKQKQVEDAGSALVQSVAQQQLANMSSMFVSHANKVLEEWWMLSKYLLFRFKANNDIEKGIRDLGYPQAWLDFVAREHESKTVTTTTKKDINASWLPVLVGVIIGVLLMPGARAIAHVELALRAQRKFPHRRSIAEPQSFSSEYLVAPLTDSRSSLPGH